MATKKRYRDGDKLRAAVFNELLDSVESNTLAIEQLKKSIPTRTSQLKNDSGFLREHQKLKTINGQSIVGSGNIVISGGTTDIPIASSTVLGGIKVGEHLSITHDGTLSADEYSIELSVDEVIAELDK